jgi:hypothetical protein
MRGDDLIMSAMRNAAMSKRTSLVVGLLGCLFIGASRASAADALEAGFASPPASAKPQVWWHWMNGNITREGITADLEAMQRVGIGGAQIFNADCDIPAGPIKFNSPAWHELFKHAVSEADRLGLQLCVHNCAGWSSSGGPWNTPEHAMQCLTSSETRTHGPSVFDAALPRPPELLGFYRDVAVLAFKAPSAETDNTSDAAVGTDKLIIKHAVYEAPDGGGSADVTAKIVAMVKRGHYSIVVGNGELGTDPASGHVKQLRVEYVIDGKPGTATAGEGKALALPASARQLAAMESAVKTSAERTFVKPPPAMLSAPDGAIPTEGVLDLTANLSSDGRLRWNVPPGNWVILRLGHTPIGVDNHPAPAEGTGPECDKFNPAALDAHWAGFVQKLIADAGPLAGKTFNNVLIDSYEVGNQDWSENFRAEFQKRRGYDPVPFLPTFTGRVVGSPDMTERFLWDMRRTVADLFADNYYGHFTELCHKSGLLASFEPYTGPYESLQCGRTADLVMGEFWTGSQGDPSVKLAASVAHIYGKQIVGAESFTASPGPARWQNDPWSLKTLGDLMYCTGLNRYIFHRYAMQPWTNRWPGMTMGPWGFHFDRTITWWEQGKAWLDYVTRCQFVLQQGRAVADAAYFIGESAPIEMRPCNPPLPSGYDYDAINADVLLNRAQVANGRLTLPDGASYAVLVLPPDDANMTPQMLRRIHDFVRDGLTVVGGRPQHSPSLQDFPACDEQVKSMADELWPRDGSTTHAVGKGAVIGNSSMIDVFSRLELKPDFQFKGEASGANLMYCHRVADGADIYFVSNQRRQFAAADCTFRVDDKLPELWHADTGIIEAAPIWSRQNGVTTVKIQFDPAGSVFVIFRHPAGDADHVIAASASVAQPASTSTHKLEIKHAVYGATAAGGGSMDVTAKLAELVAGGQNAISADNEAMGRDPAPNIVKQLRVEYTLDGKPATTTVQENELLTLPEISGHALSPAWQVASKPGKISVKTSANGTFELRTALGKTLKASSGDLPAPIEPAGAWDLKFPPHWGAPPEVKLDRLISWTDDDDSGVRYFSGTAVYEKQVEIPAEFFQDGREIWLDLGEVKNFAEVSLNGQSLATLWKPPFRVNLTGAAHAGGNTLRVKVTNLWPNRLIGDEQLPDDRDWSGGPLKSWPRWVLDGKPSPTGRFTFTTWHHWTRSDPLLTSGLLGPVQVQAVASIPAD